MKREGYVARGRPVRRYTVYKYRRNCLVIINNATAADPEFVCPDSIECSGESKRDRGNVSNIPDTVTSLRW